MKTPKAVPVVLRKGASGTEVLLFKHPLVLEHIIAVAKQRGYTRLNLETGTHAAFEPAHNLYRSKGFTLSGPFGSYRPDPHSVFMELRLGGSEA